MPWSSKLSQEAIDKLEEQKVVFFVGLHQPCNAWDFDYSFISVNRLRNRKSYFEVNKWVMDSGAFTEISTYGHYRHSTIEYAKEIKRWENCGNLLAAVSQDYMCEAFIIEKTGLSVTEHQHLTIERYKQLLLELEQLQCKTYLMPVLQGFEPFSYIVHLYGYGNLLEYGAWVGVGSVCKRNGDPKQIINVLSGIKAHRPDLKLHGFGLKKTALQNSDVRKFLYSADSMAWSFAARSFGEQNNPLYAKLFEQEINEL